MSDAAPNPARLRLKDVRSIFRLVGEVREIGADPDAWRPHMVKSLRELLGAQFVVSSEIHFRKSPRDGHAPGDRHRLDQRHRGGRL